ncbi:MAG: UvrD-helicase domain-containing protein, partial [Pseudomonadota bacterium]
MTVTEVQNRLNPAQRRAVNPTASVWVTASAGTGKTRVLASRVARLLLDGCKPHRILALTFTNAAAAEMADRVSKTLADWAVMDERTLSDVLNDLTGEVTTKERIDAARRCFARVLDDPIGLRAHTIHGFCQSLLRRFPVEAEVPPHFSLIDDRTKGELLELACEAVIGARGGGPETFGSQDAETLADVMDLDRALGLAVELMRERRKVTALPDDRILLGQAYAALLDIDPFETEASILEAACNDEAFDRAGLARLAEHLISGGARATGRGGLLQAWLSWPNDVRAATFAGHEKIFSLTSNWLISNKLHEAWPEARSVMDQERERVIAVRERANRAALARISTALSLFVKALDREYARLKRRRASLDYDDLIHEATQLLTRVRARAWVLYKLDGGLDHILVDEAQDNSRPQWDIFRAIAEELVAGKGSEATPAGATGRSLFVVGDPKQSIYRFQGAAPDAFADTRRWINDQLADAPPAERLDPVNLTTSFRSAEPILTFVDEVLADEEMPKGAFHDPSPHEAHEGADKPGLVEIWPLLRAAPKVELEPWPLPDRYDRTAGTEERLAIALAGKIAALTSDPDAPVAPADILVLVRKRSGFVSAFINALKTKDVPVEGADRLSLAEELAVRDLLVLGDFLLQRDDDLALATILRGPLVNLSEKALFDLAHDRGESRLWDRLV